MKTSKRTKQIDQALQEQEINGIEQAIDFFQNNQFRVNFDETVEIHLNLNIDVKKSQQHIKASVDLPHGTGKTPKIGVFTQPDKVQEAKSAGADTVFTEKDVSKIVDKKIKLEFDTILATPDMMPKIAKAAKILGPKGLMPSPKNETVTPDLKKTIQRLKKGLANIKNDNSGNIHQAIGKLSFKKQHLIENYQKLIQAVEKQKPEKLKSKFIKTATITTSMGPGIKI
ncbi:MAG: 50S ribosomal protein L1 [Candidatus Moranbacteria bacterium]|nr:50S ribosomal protein L1 [Candidatus Moranbacteria bacterium]